MSDEQVQAWLQGLSLEQKFELADRLHADIERQLEAEGLPPELIEELDRRAARAAADHTASVPWEVLRRRLLGETP